MSTASERMVEQTTEYGELRLRAHIKGEQLHVLMSSRLGSAECLIAIPAQWQGVLNPRLHAARDFDPESEPLFEVGVGDLPAFDARLGSDLEWGSELYKILFQSAEGRRLLPSPSSKVRMKLEWAQASDFQVGLLPWECLCDEAGPLFLRPNFSLVHCPIPAELQAEKSRPRQRILLLGCSPKSHPQLAVDVESHMLLRLLSDRGYEVRVYPEQCQDHLDRATLLELLRSGVEILHFMGHADGQNLLLTDEQGEGIAFSTKKLVELILSLESSLWPKLILLNGCETGRPARQGGQVRSLGEALARHGIAVVAMRTKISDQAAMRFSLALFKALCNDKELDDAVREGRMALKSFDDPLWSTPLLFMIGDYSHFSLQRSAPGRSRLSLGRKVYQALILILVLGMLPLLFKNVIRRIPWIGSNKELRLVLDETEAGRPGLRTFFPNALLQDTITSCKGFRLIGKGQAPESLTKASYDYRIRVAWRALPEPNAEVTIFDHRGEPRFERTRILPGLNVKVDAPSQSFSNEEAAALLEIKVSDYVLRRLAEFASETPQRVRYPAQAISDYRLALRTKDPNQARQLLLKVLELAPEMPQAHAALAAFFLWEQPDNALEEIKQAQALNPNCPAYAYGLGKVQQARGQRSAALAAFEEALRLDPDYPDAHHELGKLALKARRWSEAVGYLRNAVQLNPHSGPYFKDLGRALLEQGQSDAAREALLKAQQLLQNETQTDTQLQLAELTFLQEKLMRRDKPESGEKNLGNAGQMPTFAAFPWWQEWLAWHPQAKAQPSEDAYVIMESGYGYQTSSSIPEQLIEGGAFLSPGANLQLEANASARIWWRDESYERLVGPVTTNFEQSRSKPKELVSYWRLSALLANLNWEWQSDLPLATLESRGDEAQLDLLFPRGIEKEARPTIRLKSGAKLAGLRLVLHTPGQAVQVQLMDLPGSEKELALSWPVSWPELKQACEYELEVQARNAHGQIQSASSQFRFN